MRPPHPAALSNWRLFILLLLCVTPSPAAEHPERPLRTILLWNDAAGILDSLDQQAFHAALRGVGFDVQKQDASRIPGDLLDTHTMLIVPRSSARILSRAAIEHIMTTLREGLTLIVDGESALTDSLGLHFAGPVRIAEIKDHFRPDIEVFWADTPAVAWISTFGKGPSRVVYTDREERFPLAIIAARGKGKVLCLAPLFDDRTGQGYGRFTTLPTVIVQGLGCSPLFRRHGADAYLDMGYRYGVPPDTLARLWRAWGIRAVHVAAWYAYSTPPYDYRALIEALHRNGILAYAWLEWPYIGKGFWDRHPRWRQKNALLEDAHIDFLYLMDLQNPACMSEALRDLEVLLTLDWDGVDVAEFTLTGAVSQALEGPSRADYFTGFTDVNRKEFTTRAGFDPIEFFNPTSPHFWKRDSAGLKSFYRYRVEVNNATQQALFRELVRMNREGNRGWELILTIIDNSKHPEFDDLLGFDAHQTLDLVRQSGVTLHIEDPASEWVEPPERYIAMGQYYRHLLGDRSFMIDINVVPMKPARYQRYSTWQSTGTEFFGLWQAASAKTTRVCFYCESSVYPRDWELLPFAMAAPAQLSRDSLGTAITAPRTVVLQGAGETANYLLDGQPWPAVGPLGIVVPEGRHTLQVSPEKNLKGKTKFHLLAINGELLHARWANETLLVEYQSPSRCALTFSGKPGRLRVDGTPASLPTYAGERGYVVLAPSGRHQIILER